VIDPQILRENPELIRASLRLRGGEESLVDEAIAADQARREAISAFEALRAEQNARGKDVAKRRVLIKTPSWRRSKS
jgi:seryl-tRNA synthetase